MTIFFFGQVVADYLNSVVGSFVELSLSYDGMDFEIQTPLKSGEVMLRLAKLVEEDEGKGRSRLEVFEKRIKIRSKTLWGPDFIGTIESSDEGSILKGHFADARGATISYGAIIIGFVLLVLLILFTPAPPGLLCIYLSAVLLWFAAGLFFVSDHKTYTVPRLTAQIIEELREQI